MEVLAFLGSPRKGGNSELLLAEVGKGLAAAGATVELHRLCDYVIHPCLGCGGCDSTGRCVIDDDMSGLLEKLAVAKRVIIASPIYFYGITAQAKAFVDRTQALWSRKQLTIREGRWRADEERAGLLLAVAASRGPRLFEGASLTCQYAFDAMGLGYAGVFGVRGVEVKGAMAKEVEPLRAAFALGQRFGSPGAVAKL